jgi:hypothetical protein
MSDTAAAVRQRAMLFRVYNAGEIPVLAHGWRSVIAMHPGRKWLTLIDWATLETARVEIAAWDKLKPEPDSTMNRRKVRAVMRHRLKYAATTQAISDAIRLLNGKTP